MKKNEFDGLSKSVRQAGKVKRGELSPSRSFCFEPDDVLRIRKDLGLDENLRAGDQDLGDGPHELEIVE